MHRAGRTMIAWSAESRLGMPWPRGAQIRVLLRTCLCGGACLGFATSVVRADAPLNYLTAHGTKAAAVLPLTWAVLIISIAVILIISAMVVWAVVKRRAPTSELANRDSVSRSGGGLQLIYWGTGLSTLVLLGVTIWTVLILRATAAPPREAALTIEVRGHQWWWEVRYLSDEPSRTFTTANEIHIPVGEPVSFKLIGTDVIHSFWVPGLAGKTDMIPGQANTTWFEASRPGIYRGQCTEYCGQQHAHMSFNVVADTPGRFKTWYERQLQSPAESTLGPLAEGEVTFRERCGACHAVRGTMAGGILGPDLSHLMGRTTIAAGTLPNTPGYLSGWIADPQHVKPGNQMPRLDLTGTELTQVRAYLESLN